MDYSVEMDDNDDGVYTVVASGLTSTAHIQSGLTAGNTYKFRAKARNAVGFSDYSSIFSILAATIPSQPTAPTTTLSGSDIVIDWNPPTDTGGVSISGYKLEIKTNTSTFEKDLTNCDAETNSTIQSATSCTVPVATLRLDPFYLGDGLSVSARVTATNDCGDSTTSSEGNGATIPSS